MALSQADKQEILNAIKAESQSVDELPVVAALDGITSLPAIRGTEMVMAPISLLARPATEAAATANAAANSANSAATAATEAATNAENKANDARNAATAANQAAQSAGQAAAGIFMYSDKLDAALLGASARFDGFLDDGVIQAVSMSNVGPGSRIVFVRSRKMFALATDTVPVRLYNNWLFADKTRPADLFLNNSRSGILTDKVFICDDKLYVWSDEEEDLIEISGSGDGTGGNTLNIDELYPLANGFYTLETAIAAVAEELRSFGRCITYKIAQGKWETKQFVGTTLDSWDAAASWDDFGGGGTVKSVSVNGQKKTPDIEGNINLTINEVTIDESLNPDSTNPVQNKVIASKVQEIEAGTLFDSDVEENDDGTVTVSLKNKTSTITEFTIPAGRGGGGEGGEASGAKIVLTASVDNPTIKEGGQCLLTYFYDHQYASGDEAGSTTGEKATISIVVKRGSTTTQTITLNEVVRGTYTYDLSKYLLAGVNDIYVTAEAIDPISGNHQRKRAYISVRSVILKLASSYNPSAALNKGGYGSSDTVSMPFSVTGTGTKTVMLYVDGVQVDSMSVTRSGTVNSNFNIPMSGKSAGRHTVQMVAEMDAGNDVMLRSDSIYIDILKYGSSLPFIGTKMVFPDGRVFDDRHHLAPEIEIGRFLKLGIDFVAYDPTKTPAVMEIYRDGVKTTTMNVPRTTQQFTNRFPEDGEIAMKFVSGATEYPFTINVIPSGIDIAKASYKLVAEFDATGRSNGESEPAQWESNGYRMTFEGVDWASSGWTGDALKLTNGAKAILDHRLFATDVKATGLTVEVTYRVTNIVDRDLPVMDCIDGGKGILYTGDEASFKTGQTVDYRNEDNEEVSREVKLQTNYVAGERYKSALTIGTRAENRLMQLYMNGNRVGADVYDNSFSFMQDNPQPFTFRSEGATLEIFKVRIYERQLTDDEELENHIFDITDADEMMREYDDNDILGETGDIDIDAIRGKGKGVIRIVRLNKLDDVYAENNKKTDFPADVFFYSPYGKEYDFVLRNCYIRIQGTSSTKYPSKNIRIYFFRGGELLELTINGAVNPYGDNKYPLRPGSMPMNLYTLKSDYSDSSMGLNTGGAKLFNEVLKELGLLTPPQRYQYEHGGNSLNAITARTAIDGMPIDVFCAETEDGENTYYGQYNFNNEKSDSGAIFGMEGIEGFNPTMPLALESLNNTAKVALFQSSSDDDLAANFDAGMEVNYPGDVKWAGLSEAAKQCCRDLWGWVRACVPSGANTNDLSTFVSQKFKDEIDQHFDKDFLCTYYLWTDYEMCVDQRVKNIMWRTWDGRIWYATYYDGDTKFGKRNDCFLVYLYTITRNTWDPQMSKYAFEGHDSWLWCLLLANCMDDLRRCAQNLRSVYTVARALAMYNDEQSGNWSNRAFNKSGELKYIKPAIQEMYGKVWPFIYALQGANRAHREYMIRNRFALLDATYGTTNFTSDNIDLYMARTEADAADTVKITGSEIYAFGYGTNNSMNIANTGIVEKGQVATLDIVGAYTVNDPLRIYGASRIRILDMTAAADHIKNGFDLAKCENLQELNMQSSGTGSTAWWLNIANCRQLRRLNIRNQQQAKTGSITSTELDLTNQERLEYLDARGTLLQSVPLAKGAPVTTLMLPSSLAELRLEYLPKLQPGGLTLQGYNNVKSFVFDSCPNLDWEELLARCTRVERVRITGIDRYDDGTWLESFMELGGIDAEGNHTSACALIGTVRLTTYMEESRYARFKAHFPELNIMQPEYTIIEFDDNVSDEANISNLDNNTGYKFNNEYVPSGHVAAILAKRHRVLAKVTKKATTKSVRMGNVDTIMNNLDGEMTYYPLHDSNSNFYADADDVTRCSPALLNGNEGDIMMYEPFFWKKGVHDYLNGKHYSVYSSNSESNMPAVPGAKVLTLDDITNAGGVMAGRKVMTGKETVAASYSADSAYSACVIDVSGYAKVRFPSVRGTNLIGSVFADSDGNVIGSTVVSILGSSFTDGMYIILDIPANSATLHFTIRNSAEFDKVVLSNSTRIEDMEPEWVPDYEHLCAVVGSTVVGSKLRAVVSGGSTTANMPWSDFHYYSVSRGMQQIDFLMHSRIANLAFAKYGRRNMQDQCGGGSHTTARTTGETMPYGMQDTLGYEIASQISGTITNSIIDGVVHQYAWYLDTDNYGNQSVVQKNNICCLGYEDIYGHKYDMMDNVDVPNGDRKWRIFMPDGRIRWVQAGTSDGWISALSHGPFMDAVPVSVNATNTTGYWDYYWQSGSAGRVVYRGSYYAYAGGGVSCSSASNDAASAYVFVGSRLAFRGRIVRAQSVSAYKSIVEVA